jgi:hypothetical protein
MIVTGLRLGILIVALIGAGIVYVGADALGSWLYEEELWYLGFPIRIFQLGLTVGFLLFAVLWIYGTAREALNGKSLFED